MMRRRLGRASKGLWYGLVIGTGTALGAIHGYEQGILAAMALGFVGLVVSALVAISPRIVIEFLG